MKKRVLWLLNHTSLRKFEVPLLVELGYEVFCPKIFQVGSGDGSASITYEYDKTLSIPEDVLKRLNGVDFYEKISVETMEIVNQYFDIAMFHYFPNQFKSLVKSFHGVLVFQAFGLLGEASYTHQIVEDLGVSALQQTKQVGNRFFFAQAYQHLKDVECQYFQQRAIDMPLGLEKNSTAQWVGGDPRFLFVLPRINFASYFNQIYQKFKKDFHGLEYIIAGAQPIPVNNDANVTGYMPKEEYRRAMNHCSAMFYHSTEKNHIHYHPFEAVQNGMPLVFMGGGMIDQLGGKGLPGRCETVREARRKLSALSAGNTRLAHKIIDSQEVLLDHFLYENCKKKWETGMEKVSAALQNLVVEKRRKKIAVILPQPYLGGVLDYTLRLVKCIVKGAAERGDEISVVLGYPENPVFSEKNYFREATELGVSLRAFCWIAKSAAWMERTLELMDVPKNFARDCCVLGDGANHFEDCDYLIFTADRITLPLYSSRPYIVVAHDYIQRYLIELFGGNYEYSYIDIARRAEAVLVTTPATQADAIQYAGIDENKVFLTPLMFDLMSVPDTNLKRKFKPEKNYFLWSTNTMGHKNHLCALRGLADYYHKGGKLACAITGVNTELFDVHTSEKKLGEKITPYIREIRQLIERDDELKSNIYVKGNLPKEYYARLLQRAKFTFHPGYADNGNGTAIDAACLGVPTICSDYPAMRYINEHVGINAHFFDPFDEESICQALLNGEAKCTEYAKCVPTRDKLELFTVEGTYSKIYEIIDKVMRE